MASKKRAPQPPKRTPRGRLVQARVPDPVYARVVNCANTEMISVAAYVRRLISTHTPGG